MATDLTLPAEGGFLNLRVGAIIEKDGKVLMVRSPAADYCYSVGGRVCFGETLEQAVLREVLEETGVPLQIDRLGFVHEAFFTGDSGKTAGKPVQELSFYFYMQTPADFSPVNGGLSGEGRGEVLVWLDPLGDTPCFPAFFRTELAAPAPFIKHIVTDERPAGESLNEDGLHPNEDNAFGVS